MSSTDVANASPERIASLLASGPLLFDTPDILAEILHPAAFPPAHEGAVWRRWP